MRLTLDFGLQLLGAMAGMIILHYALTAINRMGRETHHGVRVAFVLIACGAFAQIINPLTATELEVVAGLMISCGLALLLVFDRRCVTCPVSSAKTTRRRRDDERVAAT